MAESQVPYPYLQADLQAIRSSVSEPRFSTYLVKGGNHEEYAMALYLYNARVAKAFLFPLNVAEVTLRNAVDSILVTKFGANWHLDPTFRNTVLTAEGLWTLDKAIQRAGQNAKHDQVVATLTFDFWSNLFRPEYGALWRTTVNIAFPNLKHGESRQDIQNLVRPINTFRNRVAHHEPVLDMNIIDVFAKIARLIDLRCTTTAGWMKHHSTLAHITRTRPKPHGQTASVLAAKVDHDFVRANPQTLLIDLAAAVDAKHQAIVCLDAGGLPVCAFTILDVLAFIRDRAAEMDGMVDLKDHKVADLLASGVLDDGWVAMEETTPFGLCVKQLQQPKIQILVSTDPGTGQASGAILRAHRRY